MKKIIFLLVLIIATMLMHSCDPVAIDDELPDGSAQLSITSYFKADSSIGVHLVRGKHILDSDFTPFEAVNNATITVSGATGLPVTLQLQPSGYQAKPEGFYTSSSGFRVGETCMINVSAAGFPGASAACYIPRPVAIQKAIIPPTEKDDMGLSPVDVYFNDPPEEKNYYRVVMRFGKRAADGTIEYFSTEESEALTYDPVYFFDPESFSLEPDKRALPVLFADDPVNGSSIKISCRIFANLSHDNASPNRVLQVELQTLSKEYYLSYTTQALQRELKNNPFAQPIQIYSNVKGGFGIFAALSCSQFNVDL